MAQQLAKRVLNHPTLTRGTVRLLTVPAGAAETKKEEVVEKKKEEEAKKKKKKEESQGAIDEGTV